MHSAFAVRGVSLSGRRTLRWILATILFGSLVDAPAQAAHVCARGAFWPNEGELPSNPVFLFATCGESLESHDPFLEGTNGERIELRVRESISGAYLLEPELPLRAAVDYGIRWVGQTDRSRKPWRSTGEPDQEAPQWRAGPQLDVSRSRHQCGLDAAIATELQDPAEPVFALVELQNEWQSTSEATTIIDWRWKGDGLDGVRIYSASDTCQPTVLGYGATYRISITYVDAGGNRSEPKSIHIRTPDPRPFALCLADSEITDANATHRVEPQCTVLAHRARVTGTIEGVLEVGSGGEVDGVRIEKGLPMGLDAATTEAVRNWRFEPSDEPVRSVRFRTTFRQELPPYEQVWKQLP
jgi:hypothetical protein